jgi:hypothetical protein
MSLKNLLRRACAIFGCCASAVALAAPVAMVPADDLAVRYDGLGRCMARTLGAGWQERYQIHMVINRWGRAEPNGAEMDAAPQTIRVTDLQCRRQLGLSGSARPDEPGGMGGGTVAEGRVGAHRADQGSIQDRASQSSEAVRLR